ncbi:MAG: copper chaperone PCu(A)C [Alphaproteobacteria bacterium]|nr:copper chaperone PCu(A)C [Alphaproteobacteria bacterium]
MKRMAAVLALTLLTGCSYMGLSETEDQAVATTMPPGAEQVAAAEPATAEQPAGASTGAKSIKPPMPQSTLVIADAWAMVSPRGTKVSAGYFTVANGGTENDRLVSASTPRAARTELHEITQENGVAKMRPVAGVEVPTGGSASLSESGLHVMFIDVDTPFTEGETIPVQLTFEKAGTIEVTMRAKRGGKVVAQH